MTLYHRTNTERLRSLSLLFIHFGYIGLRWTVLYGFTIIGFGVLYYLLPPNSFYQSTLEADEYNRSQLEQAETLLSVGFIEKGLLSRLDLPSSDLFGTPTRAEVKLEFARARNHLSGEFRVYAGDDRLYLHEAVTVSLGKTSDELYLFPVCPGCKGSIFRAAPPGYSIPVDPSTKDLVNGLLQLQQDVMPRNASTLVKYIYFSGITAATIGYGDIVPITTAARIIATVQAVISIVLLGLFINALTTASLIRSDKNH